MRRLLAVAVATLLLLAAPAAPALAQTSDPNSGTLIYSGEYGGSPGTLEFECAGGVCVSDDVVPPLTFTNGLSQETVQGELSQADCDYLVTSTRDLVMRDGTLTGTSQLDEVITTCDGQSTSQGSSPPSSFSLELAQGDACLIDGSCSASGAPSGPASDVTTAEALEAAAGPFTPGARNDQPLPAGGDREFAAPTELSQVATIADVITPANLAWAAGGTVVLGALIVLPTAFAGSATETLLGRLRTWWRRRRGLPDSDETGGFRGWPWATAGVGAAAILTAFADPNFGFDAAAGRVLLSIAVAFALEVAVGWVAVILLMRATTPSAKPAFSFTPLSLLVVAGAVVLARVSGFEPAVVFGLVAGFAFVGLVTAAQHARVPLLTLGWAYAIGMIAWVVYSLLDATDPGLVIVRELLAAATLAGVSALPVALLPLPGLPGQAIWAWRKPVWLAAYAVALFTFLLVLLPLPGAWSEVGTGLTTWIVLFVVYCVAAFGVWFVVNRTGAKDGAVKESAQV